MNTKLNINISVEIVRDNNSCLSRFNAFMCIAELIAFFYQLRNVKWEKL